MKRLLISLITCVSLDACAESPSELIDTEYFATVCDVEYRPRQDCEKLNGKKIQLNGTLYYPSVAPRGSVYPNKAGLFPLNVDFPADEGDPR